LCKVFLWFENAVVVSSLLQLLIYLKAILVTGYEGNENEEWVIIYGLTLHDKKGYIQNLST
jgi:hypothetical protein